MEKKIETEMETGIIYCMMQGQAGIQQLSRDCDKYL